MNPIITSNISLKCFQGIVGIVIQSLENFNLKGLLVRKVAAPFLGAVRPFYDNMTTISYFDWNGLVRIYCNSMLTT